MQNLFELLKVTVDVSPSNLRFAYIQLAAENHPDKNGSDEARTKFREINYAYSILSDKDKRSKYNLAALFMSE